MPAKLFFTAIAPIFTNPITPPSFTYYVRNVSILMRPRKAPDWGHTVANFISSKSIKYLKCTWHSADFTTAAPLKVNGAENLFIYADDRCGTLRLGQWTHRGPGVGGGWGVGGGVGGLRESFVLQMKISTPASHYSGSAAARTGDVAASHATCTHWEREPPSLLLVALCSRSICADPRAFCTSKQNYNVPTVKKMWKAEDWVNVSGWGWSVCI